MHVRRPVWVGHTVRFKVALLGTKHRRRWRITSLIGSVLHNAEEVAAFYPGKLFTARSHSEGVVYVFQMD